MSSDQPVQKRKGARRMSDVPAQVLRELSLGETESVNLMEWLATDMVTLADSVSNQCDLPTLQAALQGAADEVVGKGVVTRLQVFGQHVAALPSAEFGKAVRWLAKHRSDVVRQWACFAVNHESRRLGLRERLSATEPYATDHNMSVREAAWIAFRPYVVADLQEALSVLRDKIPNQNENVRRFCVEVTRPRSVWGVHIKTLKEQPWIAEDLLNAVMSDDAKYVQLAVGNWLNDASKTSPEWVQAFCSQWERSSNSNTRFILRRGLRTLAKASDTGKKQRDSVAGMAA